MAFECDLQVVITFGDVMCTAAVSRATQRASGARTRLEQQRIDRVPNGPQRPPQVKTQSIGGVVDDCRQPARPTI